MCSIISPSIIYGITSTAKTQLQKITTCHAINNVGGMHIFACPLRLLLQYEKFKDLLSIARIPDGFGSQYTMIMYLILYDLP
jgi:hypothetical protein